ncbi:hypothetical protein LX97_03116 [Nonlabens dokdonensis]|uniref:HNH nuclease n=2 Tax=Nonlabens dokdonensis TaxID=328515 RepID=L7WDK3_NONDD|nr:HNH endonuclease signature motif containing protein [Nonlabens dokdonensis]AGC78026.1 HNH nuclease [Nonlabens dokdonensis DSW-6]PZX37094.1 hypothetical protein LX97_03116 [Nonlabens dokdonensis]
MNKRKNPNYKLKIKLLQEVKLKCPFCNYADASKLEHHHIDGNPANTVFKNLISVCPNCHTSIESGEISESLVIKTKNNLSINADYLYKGIYTFDNFRIHKNRVGILKKGMTIKDLYTILPSNQIRKTVAYGEHPGEDMYDSYEIYNSNGEILLAVETSENGNINDLIRLISIKSTKFHTLSDVRLGVSISEIMHNEHLENFQPDLEHIHFKIEWINASCSIDKKQLNDDWWNNEKKRIELRGENLESKIDSITIRW